MKTDAFGGSTPAAQTPAPAPALSHEEQTAQNNAQRQADASAFGSTVDPAAGNPNKPTDPAVKAAADKAEAAAKAKADAKAAKDAKSKAPTADGTDGTNQPEGESERFKELRENAKKLGSTEGAGVNSRAELAVTVAQASRDGILNPSKKSPDVANVWQEFQDARVAAKMDSAGKDDNGKQQQKSAEVQVSKLRQFAKAGAPSKEFDFTKVLARARDLINKEAGKANTFLDKSTFEALLIVARAHASPSCKKGMTNPELIELLRGSEPELPSLEEHELAELEAIYKRCEKLQAGTDNFAPADSTGLSNAMNALRTRIVPLKDKLDKEREAEKAKQAPPPVSPPAAQVGNAA